MKRCWPYALAGLLLLTVPLTIAANRATAAEEMPPLMRQLLELFPEGGGWFVEGPLGVPAGTPEKAQPFFQRPRVVVPDVGAVQTATAKLFAAGNRLPLRRMVRYDEKPGADGFPAVRGIWCQTENEDDVGFWVLTPNQNRFLIWAHDAYFPACLVDSLEAKVRDWYARSVSEYLASLDFNVPGSYPPIAAERNLPPWLDLYPPLPVRTISSDRKFVDFLQSQATIHLWGCQGITAFIPASETIQRLIDEAVDSLHVDRELFWLQREYDIMLNSGGQQSQVSVLTQAVFDSLSTGSYLFAVDRYGRVRIAPGGGTAGNDADTSGVPDHYVHSHAMLFPGDPVLAAGWMQLQRADGRLAVHAVDPFSRTYYYSPFDAGLRDIVTSRADLNLLTLGHLFTKLTELEIPFDGCLIRKF